MGKSNLGGEATSGDNLYKFYYISELRQGVRHQK